MKDLDTRGFAVLHNWMSSDEAKTLMEVYDKLPPDRVANGGNNVGYKTPIEHGMNLFEEVPGLPKRLLKTVKDIHKQTSMKLLRKDRELDLHGMFVQTNISVRNTMMFPWHQDHDSFWTGNNHKDLVNFYIVVAKEYPDEAGLQVVPFDHLRSQSPDLWKLVEGNGATVFHDLGPNEMLATLDTHDDDYVLDFHLDNLSCTPMLRGGDLLLLRGDMIHRTQAHKSWRTSLTIRTTSHSKEGNGDPFDGGLAKYWFMAVSPDMYGEDDLSNRLRIYSGFLYRLLLYPMRLFLGALVREEPSKLRSLSKKLLGAVGAA